MTNQQRTLKKRLVCNTSRNHLPKWKRAVSTLAVFAATGLALLPACGFQGDMPSQRRDVPTSSKNSFAGASTAREDAHQVPSLGGVRAGRKFSASERESRRILMGSGFVKMTPEIQERIQEVSKRYESEFELEPSIVDGTLNGIYVAPKVLGAGDRLFEDYIFHYIPTGKRPKLREEPRTGPGWTNFCGFNKNKRTYFGGLTMDEIEGRFSDCSTELDTRMNQGFMYWPCELGHGDRQRLREHLKTLLDSPCRNVRVRTALFMVEHTGLRGNEERVADILIGELSTENRGHVAFRINGVLDNFALNAGGNAKLRKIFRDRLSPES